jgi:hypothetical protein
VSCSVRCCRLTCGVGLSDDQGDVPFLAARPQRSVAIALMHG